MSGGQSGGGPSSGADRWKTSYNSEYIPHNNYSPAERAAVHPGHPSKDVTGRDVRPEPVGPHARIHGDGRKGMPSDHQPVSTHTDATRPGASPGPEVVVANMFVWLWMEKARMEKLRSNILVRYSVSYEALQMTKDTVHVKLVGSDKCAVAQALRELKGYVDCYQDRHFEIYDVTKYVFEEAVINPRAENAYICTTPDGRKFVISDNPRDAKDVLNDVRSHDQRPKGGHAADDKHTGRANVGQRKAAEHADVQHQQQQKRQQQQQQQQQQLPVYADPPVGELNMKWSSTATIHVYEADITRLHVDAIVNAADAQLYHVAGVARAIAVGAGEQLQKDCDKRVKDQGPLAVTQTHVTEGYKLPAKYVIHAVGPDSRAIPDLVKLESMMYQTFANCLAEASQRNLKTIAIPAVSSGVYAVPVELVATQLYKAVTDHLAMKGCTLTGVLLVDLGRQFLHQLQQIFMSGTSERRELTIVTP